MKVKSIIFSLLNLSKTATFALLSFICLTNCNHSLMAEAHNTIYAYPPTPKSVRAYPPTPKSVHAQKNCAYPPTPASIEKK